MEEAPSKNQTRDNARAKEYKKRFEKLEAERSSLWDSIWQEIADYMLVRKGGIQKKLYTAQNAGEQQLFDTTGEQALTIAAAGFTSWTTPAFEDWFSFAPSREFRDRDPVKLWLLECSELVKEYLAKSNFYSEIHEDNTTLMAFCTTAMQVQFNEESRRLQFESLRIGSYVIAEDGFGQVDTIMRKFQLSAHAAAQRFGEENLPKSIRECLEGDKDPDKLFHFLHVICPRPKEERGDGVGYTIGQRKAFASCYIAYEECQIVREGGYDSFPVPVSRYEKCDFLDMSSPWGYGPGFKMLPEARQKNFLEKMLDVAAEKITFPPMMVPDSYDGDLVTSARAINYYPAGIQEGQIYPLQTIGDLRASLERSEVRRKAINSKAHVEMFQMMAQLDRQMTAREVAERASEKIEAITPAFARRTTEMVDPLLMRVFELCAENGMLPPPPMEAVRRISPTMVDVPNPSVTYTSRLALAIRQLRTLSADRQIARLIEVASAGKPEVLDTVDWSKWARGTTLDSGMPSEYILSEEQMQQIAEARAQAMAQQQQMQMIAEGAKAAGSAAKAGPLLEQVLG